MKSILLTAMLFFLTFGHSQAVTINVPGDEPTIQAAVDIANAGDIILVADGSYTESVDIGSGPAGISIQAANPGGAIISGGIGPAFYTNAHIGDVSISGFVLTTPFASSTSGVIGINNLTGKLSLINNNISALGTNGIYIRNSASMDTEVSLLDNIFGTMGNKDCIYIEAGVLGNGGNANILIDGNSNTGNIENNAIAIKLGGNNSSNILLVTNNNFSNWTASGSGIRLDMADGSPVANNQQIHFIFEGNTFSGPYTDGMIIDIDGISNDVYGIIRNNTISGDGINTGDGIFIDGDSSGKGITASFQILNNNISNTTDDGIHIRPFNDTTDEHIWNFIIDNNSIDNPNADNAPVGGTEAAIHINESVGIDDEHYTINAEITNNTITNINANTTCIRIARPTTTTAGIAAVNYFESGNTGCTAALIGGPTLATDPVPNTLDLLGIGNLVWYDENGDGIKDNTESGVEGVEISFAGNGLFGTTSTNTHGNYFLPALTPGVYTLTISPTADLPFLTKLNQGTDDALDSDFDTGTQTVSVTITAGGADDLSVDAGLSNIILPIKLLSFKGEARSNGNQLDWATLSENESSHFEIEQSVDGLSFTQLGKVDGSGNTTFVNEYSYLDYNPVSRKNYYRLKMVDRNGSYEYSSIIFIESSRPGGTVIIYPNPGHDFIKVKATHLPLGELHYAIFAANGARVAAGLTATNGSEINISQLPIGMYMMELNIENEPYRFKFYKQ